MIAFYALLACNNNAAWDTTLPPVVGVANIDDDNGNGKDDWEDNASDEENDFSTFTIPADMFDVLKSKHSLVLRQQDNGFRIYADGTLKTNSADDFFTVPTPEKGNDLTLEVEFESIHTTGEITLEWQNQDKDVLQEMTVEFISAPMLLNHHLQPMEHVYAMAGSGFVNNQQFIAGFENALGDQFTSYPVRDYDWDVWLQDEVEFSNLASNDARIDIVIDSIRNRGLDDLPEDYWEGPDVPVKTWGRGQANSQDSFGNLEVAPPVDGYPFGRIYYGDWYYGGTVDTITEPLVDQMTSYGAQDPFTLDVTFLCVGHVDEYMTFIPDASSPKGFKFLLADVDAGYEFLDSLDPNMSLSKYGSDKGYPTVGSITADTALRRLNEDIQLDYIEPTWDTMQDELGLTEDDIIRIPMLFEEAPQCGGYTATLIPSTLNMVVATNADGTGADLVMPDPYFRSSIGDQASDVFIQHVNSLLPEGNTPHWIDDWNDYHMMLGEVHCGSNTKRTPINISEVQ